MTTDSSEATSGWRRVGESIIYNEEEVLVLEVRERTCFEDMSGTPRSLAIKASEATSLRPPGEKGRDESSLSSARSS